MAVLLAAALARKWACTRLDCYSNGWMRRAMHVGIGVVVLVKLLHSWRFACGEASGIPPFENIQTSQPPLTQTQNHRHITKFRNTHTHTRHKAAVSGLLRKSRA